MTTLELPWLKVSLSDTLYFATPDKDQSAYALQWHTSASTLFVMFRDKAEIDLRLDREIVEIQFQDPASDDWLNASPENNGTAFICLTMLPSRPLPWAKGTRFDPMFDDRNGICIQVPIDTDLRRKNYGLLVTWMKRNVNEGEAISLDVQKAARLWVKNQSLQCVPQELSDDETETTNKRQAVNDPVVLKTAYGELTKGDIKKLQPQDAMHPFIADYSRWANDNLLAFGLKYAATVIRKKYPTRKFHVLRTSFYQNLVNQGPESLSEMNSKIDLFKQDFVLVPVHMALHWFLVIIDCPGRSTKATNKEADAKPCKPAFYIFDSMKDGHPDDVFEKMRDFLIKYSRERNNPVDSAKFRRYNVSVPLQRGFNDCGFYMLHFAEKFMEDPERCREIILAQRETNLMKHWGDPSTKRADFLRVVEDLQKPAQEPSCFI